MVGKNKITLLFVVKYFKMAFKMSTGIEQEQIEQNL